MWSLEQFGQREMQAAEDRIPQVNGPADRPALVAANRRYTSGGAGLRVVRLDRAAQDEARAANTTVCPPGSKTPISRMP